MSELNQNSGIRNNIHRKLLTGASALALGASLASAACAEDGSQPQIWIEVGGQGERASQSADVFKPPFFSNTPTADLAPMLEAQRQPPYSIGLDGKITFTPEKSDWTIVAAVRYGRSGTKRHQHQQTPLPYLRQYLGTAVASQPGVSQFGDGQNDFTESHVVVDFQVGKDVGLGLFGVRGSSVVSAGVRYASFSTLSKLTLNARPENEVGASHYAIFTHIYRSLPAPHYETFRFKNYDMFRHTYAATMQAQRDAHGVGPAMSWNASVPIAGDSKNMALNFDWGINGALLFGRQRTRERHKSSGHYFSQTGGPFLVGVIHVRSGALYAPHSPIPQTRTHNVMIPNLGGTLGMSLKFSSAAISFGYRADVFFNALDGGIDARKTYNRSFYGPYASISIGLGG